MLTSIASRCSCISIPSLTCHCIHGCYRMPLQDAHLACAYHLLTVHPLPHDLHRLRQYQLSVDSHPMSSSRAPPSRSRVAHFSSPRWLHGPSFVDATTHGTEGPSMPATACRHPHDLLHQCRFVQQLNQLHDHLLIHGTSVMPSVACSSSPPTAHSHPDQGHGALCHAYNLFDGVPHPDRVTCSNLIRPYNNSSWPQEALRLTTACSGEGCCPMSSPCRLPSRRARGRRRGPRASGPCHGRGTGLRATCVCG
jgi:hypothetical protein